MSFVAVMAQNDESKKPVFNAEANFALFSSAPVTISCIRLQKFIIHIGKNRGKNGASVSLKTLRPKRHQKKHLKSICAQVLNGTCRAPMNFSVLRS